MPQYKELAGDSPAPLQWVLAISKLLNVQIQDSGLS